MRQKRIYLFSIILWLSVGCAFAQKSETIETADYIFYIPENISGAEKRPLCIALSPNADAQAMINTWKPVANKYKWLIFASKEFRNGVASFKLFNNFPQIIDHLSELYPIDKTRIIATGFSGGGMGSHQLSFLYPELIRAIVINTGMMHEYFAAKKNEYPRSKIAVFLASPTDFRYQEMQRDRAFLEDLGWQTKWIEFSGGHTIAPEATYQEAAQWLAQNLEY
jgi:predicted esterase